MSALASSLADCLRSSGLGGHCWIATDDKLLIDSAQEAFAPGSVHAGIPSDGDLNGCSVVVLPCDRFELADGFLGGLPRQRRRPLLVFHGSDALPEALSERLLALGYVLPPLHTKDSSLLLCHHWTQDHKRHFDVARYWDERYRGGRNSGSGSYGRLAHFKARYINALVASEGIRSVVELGCGDGAQLGLADYPDYLGLDLSPTVIERCRRLFRDDPKKRFEVYEPELFDPSAFRAEMALSLDVIYHLSDDTTYRRHLDHLFGASTRMVVIYANSEEDCRVGVDESAGYVRFRNVLADIAAGYSEWRLVRSTPNTYPYSAANPSETSFADFHVFERVVAANRRSKASVDMAHFASEKILNTLRVSDENSAHVANDLSIANRKLREISRQLSRFDDLHGLSRRFDEVQELLGGSQQRIVGIDARMDDLFRVVTTFAKQNLDVLNESTALRGDVERLQAERQRLDDACRALQVRLDEANSRLLQSQEHFHRTEIERNKADTLIADLRHQLDAAFARDEGQTVEIRSARQRIGVLESDLAATRSRCETLTRQHQEQTRLHEEISAKYREANAKYRRSCQQIAALRASRPYRIGSGFDRALRPVRVVFGLPRSILGRVGGRKASPGWVIRFLSYVKWKWVVPVVTRLGMSEARAARLTLPGFPIPEPAGSSDSSRPATAPGSKGMAAAKDSAFPVLSVTAQEVSILGWPAPPTNGRPLVLAVMDEFTEGCLGSDVRLLQPRPDNWYALANRFPPAMVFIESAWRGNGGSWQYRVGSYSVQPGKELAHLLAWARQQGIPSVFWNKEDPVHHEKFMTAAALADHVFTTDENMLASYRARTGNQSVHVLPFAAQPALHKPEALAGRIRKCCFAGSWYGNRHAARGDALQWLLRVANRHGLDIFDRNHGSGNFPFPDEYAQCVRGSLPYRELCREYARYRVYLNVNSVFDSPSMFSRRVFELMACGTPVVSTWAQGIEETFSSGAVWLVRDETEANEAIRTLLENDDEWRRRSLAGLREVHSGHTYAHRLNHVFRLSGTDAQIETAPPIVLLARAPDAEALHRLLSFADTQSYAAFELVIATDHREVNLPTRKNIRLVEPESLSDLATTAAPKVGGMGWLSPRGRYGPDYLTDLVNAMRYHEEADGWGKAVGPDRFGLADDGRLDGAIWRPGVFVSRWLGVDAPELQIGGLYCVDSDGFDPEAVR